MDIDRVMNLWWRQERGLGDGGVVCAAGSVQTTQS